MVGKFYKRIKNGSKRSKNKLLKKNDVKLYEVLYRSRRRRGRSYQCKTLFLYNINIIDKFG